MYMYVGIFELVKSTTRNGSCPAWRQKCSFGCYSGRICFILQCLGTYSYLLTYLLPEMNNTPSNPIHSPPPYIPPIHIPSVDETTANPTTFPPKSTEKSEVAPAYDRIKTHNKHRICRYGLLYIVNTRPGMNATLSSFG